MSKRLPYDQPSDVAAEQGEVTVDGPDGVAVSLTPDAALETADRLAEASAEAHGQNVMRELGHPGESDATGL